jgi:nitroimidazol reductase NimA-like FMN-containing flavoprotein (pyridoxamine 5'-phosphate oxidase superfamily)
VVPIYFAYADRHLYAISTMGQKIEWMRTNPRVCVEIDEINSPDEWMSLVVLGRYEELPDRSEFKRAREQALELLQKRSAWWWEPACVCENHRDSPHSCTPVAYRIHIDRITGQYATPEIAPIDATTESKTAKQNLVSRLLARLRHRQSNGRVQDDQN